MVRIARIVIPDIPHHVTQRGNRRQQTFFHEHDYKSYLEFLAAYAKVFSIDIWSYCLMPNHVHLLLVPKSEDGLREGLSQTHQSYTRLINRRNGWTGHLWQGRFFSCPVDPDRAAIVAQYIELNPVRARLCEHPCDYPWSSAKAACSGRTGRLNGFAPMESPFGTWEEFLCSGISSLEELNSIRKSATSGRPFGSEQFVARLEGDTGRKLIPEIAGRRSNQHNFEILNS